MYINKAISRKIPDIVEDSMEYFIKKIYLNHWYFLPYGRVNLYTSASLQQS